MDLLTLASRHRDWLALRQTTIAANIANANTPGFSAQQVQSFSEALSAAGNGAEIAASHPRHLAVVDAARAGSIDQREEVGGVTHSGNSVNLEDEMLAAGAVKREYSLNVSIARTFRRMVMAGLRG